MINYNSSTHPLTHSLHCTPLHSTRSHTVTHSLTYLLTHSLKVHSLTNSALTAVIVTSLSPTVSQCVWWLVGSTSHVRTCRRSHSLTYYRRGSFVRSFVHRPSSSCRRVVVSLCRRVVVSSCRGVLRRQHTNGQVTGRHWSLTLTLSLTHSLAHSHTSFQSERCLIQYCRCFVCL